MKRLLMQKYSGKALCLALALSMSAFSGAAFAVANSEAPAPIAGKAAAPTPANGDATGAQPSSQPGQGKVNINTASAEDLAKTMSGIGSKKAQAIVSYREQYGPFTKLEDLKQVPGIGDALFQRNLDHLSL